MEDGLKKYCLVFNEKHKIGNRYSNLIESLGEFRDQFDIYEEFPDNIADYKLILAHDSDINDDNIAIIRENSIPTIFFSGGFVKEVKIKKGIYRVQYILLLNGVNRFIKEFNKTGLINIDHFKIIAQSDIFKDEEEIKENIERSIAEHTKLKGTIYKDIISFLKTKSESILFADDDLKQNVSDNSLHLNDNIENAKAVVNSEKLEIAILDIEFINSDKDGFEILKEIRKKTPKTKVIMLSGYDNFDMAFKSFRMGADHFISKQNFNIEYFKGIVELIQMEDAPLIIGKSNATLEMFRLLTLYSKYKQDILILGGNGSGKELIAKSIFHLSNNKGKFLSKNCAGIPDTLFEAEMFGYEKGAFSGAVNKKSSPFEMAKNGVLFLDEIGDLPENQQTKLLRVVQERTVTPLGSIEENKFETRLIFATNKNLEEEISNGNFREDFYYRITGAEIHSPNLVERKEDIELLTAYFINKFIKDNEVKNNLENIKVTDDNFNRLKEYNFPGNIRELEKLVNQSLFNYLSNPKANKLEITIPEKLLTEEENITIKFIPIESIIEMIKSKALTTRGLSEDLREQIFTYYYGQGKDNNYIAEQLDVNPQSIRNMRAKFKK
jgi:DNA-binding NtrC family response regulator